MNSKHYRPHLPPPPPPTCSPHPKLQERKFPIKQTRHHQLYGARTAAPIYQFSHLSLKPYEHIDDYRRSCSSVSSIQQQQEQQEQPPHHQPTSNGLPLKKTVATPSVVQMVKERCAVHGYYACIHNFKKTCTFLTFSCFIFVLFLGLQSAHQLTSIA